MHAELPIADPPHDAEESARVAAYLRAHPGFLASQPGLYEVLVPPVRRHGEAVADHMAAMIAAARARAARVLGAGRAQFCIAERVQEAVLALMRAGDPLECVSETWPGLLGVDAARLVGEGPPSGLAAGGVARLLGGRAMLVRDYPADAALLHGEAASLAARDVLVRVPGRRAALLALANREAACLPAARGWVFLGRALGVEMERKNVLF